MACEVSDELLCMNIADVDLPGARTHGDAGACGIEGDHAGPAAGVHEAGEVAAGQGLLRRQEGCTDVLATAFLLSRHLDDADFQWAEEDLSGLYRNHGVFDHLSYGMKQATLLMAADFVHLLAEGRHVLVSLGVDEHKYVALARRGAERWGLPADHLGGIYTKMIPGLGGLPKMSKSIPGSGITAALPPDDIRALLAADPDSGPEDDTSALLQMIACLPETDGDAYDLASEARRSGGRRWQQLRDELTERLIGILALWPQS